MRKPTLPVWLSIVGLFLAMCAPTEGGGFRCRRVSRCYCPPVCCYKDPPPPTVDKWCVWACEGGTWAFHGEYFNINAARRKAQEVQGVVDPNCASITEGMYCAAIPKPIYKVLKCEKVGPDYVWVKKFEYVRPEMAEQKAKEIGGIVDMHDSLEGTKCK